MFIKYHLIRKLPEHFKAYRRIQRISDLEQRECNGNGESCSLAWKCELTQHYVTEIMKTERMSVYVLSILNSLDSNVVVNINLIMASIASPQSLVC